MVMVALFLAASVTVVLAGEIFFMGYDSYGRTKWISCGSTSGNYGYVCDSENRCYQSEALTEEAADLYPQQGYAGVRSSDPQ